MAEVCFHVMQIIFLHVDFFILWARVQFPKLATQTSWKSNLSCCDYIFSLAVSFLRCEDNMEEVSIAKCVNICGSPESVKNLDTCQYTGHDATFTPFSVGCSEGKELRAYLSDLFLLNIPVDIPTNSISVGKPRRDERNKECGG